MATIKRRKKNTRQRAGTTHGWGAMKKHRGAGHRGGRGNAGTGKRGDAKKPSYWKDLKRYGKHGFTSKSVVESNPINVGHVASTVDRLVREGKAQKGKAFTVDLNALGYDLLLGTGIVNVALDVTVGRATAKAVEKIEKAGGKVTQTAPKTKKADKAETAADE
jgi:large subunit ribosomal protein L15